MHGELSNKRINLARLAPAKRPGEVRHLIAQHLIDLTQVICDPTWNHAKAVDFLQNALYQQIGVSPIVDGSNDGEATHVGTWRTLSKKVFWDRDVAL